MSESEIFKAALSIPPSERSNYLDGACRNDAALRERLSRFFVRLIKRTRS